MNYSQLINPVKEITKGCFNWCKEQHFVFKNNLNVKVLGIIALAMVVLFAGDLIYKFSDKLLRKFLRIRNILLMEKRFWEKRLTKAMWFMERKCWLLRLHGWKRF